MIGSVPLQAYAISAVSKINEISHNDLAQNFGRHYVQSKALSPSGISIGRIGVRFGQFLSSFKCKRHNQ